MEEIIIPILQMRNGGKDQWEAPRRVQLPQKEVVELPCTDTAILCTAALWDLSKVTQEISIIFIPSKFKFVACQSKRIHCRTVFLLRNHTTCQNLHEGDKWRIPQWPLLSMGSCELYTYWHLNTVFVLNFIFLRLDEMQCPLVKYHTLSIPCKGPTLSILTNHSCLTHPGASGSQETFKAIWLHTASAGKWSGNSEILSHSAIKMDIKGNIYCKKKTS